MFSLMAVLSFTIYPGIADNHSPLRKLQLRNLRLHLLILQCRLLNGYNLLRIAIGVDIRA